MKVAIIHTDFKLYWPARILALKQQLEARGDELHVIEIASTGTPYDFSSESQESTASWHILFKDKGIRELSSRLIRRELQKALDALQPDVCLAGAIAFPSGAITVAWAKKNNKRVVIFDSSKIEHVQRGRLVNFIKQKIYNNVDAVIYPAKGWLPTAKYWGFNEEDFFIGVDVVDNDFWKRTAQHPYKPNGEILYIGRLLERKKVDMLIKTFQSLQMQYPNRLHIIGDGPEIECLQNMINDADAITISGFMSQAELKSALMEASLLVLPSNYETWGLVVNEALAAGVPAICSNRCGVSSIIKQGVNGFVFDSDSQESLHKSLDSFMSLSDEQKAQLSRNSEEGIKNWGLSFFATQATAAIDYVSTKNCHQPSFIEKIVLTLWNGRYRPL